MNLNEFNQLVLDLQELQRKTLLRKSDEYSSADDRLRSLHRISRMRSKAMAQVVIDLADKHLESVLSMVESGRSFTRAQWEEKIGDLVNYYGPLLFASLVSEGLVGDLPVSPGRCAHELARALKAEYQLEHVYCSEDIHRDGNTDKAHAKWHNTDADWIAEAERVLK